jgi:signal transduction histidine kinase
MYTYGDRRIFEYVHRGPDGMMARIGLSTAELEHIQATHIRRLLLYTLFIMLILGTLSIYTMKKQSLSMLERKYRQVQTYSGAIIEEMNEGLIVLDGSTRIRTINRAALNILKKDNDLNGKGIDALSGFLPGALLNRLERLEQVEDFPLRIRSGNTEYRHILVSSGAFPFSHDGQEDLIYLILLRDYTSQKELEDLRQRRSKLLAIGQLASRVAHEIRNPLNGIGVLAQRIRKEFRPEEDISEFDDMTDSIREETSRINAIIETFLAYAKTPDLKLSERKPDELIKEVLPVLSPICEEKNMRIETAIDATKPVLIDTDQMKQVLINLVKNAVEVAEENTVVRIRIRSGRNAAVIELEDQGPGIPLEEQDKVFDLYFTTKESGSGLGLSIVEKIISAHGGEITVESPYERYGRMQAGTRFRIMIPAPSSPLDEGDERGGKG